ALRKGMRAFQHRFREELPGRHTDEQIRRIVCEWIVEQFAEHDAKYARHGERPQQRPADAQKRPFVTLIEIFSGEREPKVTELPNSAKIIQVIDEGSFHSSRVPAVR